MRFGIEFNILLLFLLILSSVIALNDQCNTGSYGYGVCVKEDQCKLESGQVGKATAYKGYCPNDPNDILCCIKTINILKNGTKLSNEGTCKNVNNCSTNSNIIYSGECPGNNYVKLCVPISNSSSSSPRENSNNDIVIDTSHTSSHNTYNDRKTKNSYIIIHYTAGCTSKSGSAINIANYFKNTDREASADFIVDDELIVQYTPDPEKYSTWAVGDKKKNNQGGSMNGIINNNNSISIEICSSNTSSNCSNINSNDESWYFTPEAVNNGIKLTKYLMKKYNIPASNVYRHYDVSGKLCPGIVGWNKDSGSEENWISFKNKLETMEEEPSHLISIDGRCGLSFNNAICPNNECCSHNNWCGTSDDHCNISKGCQSEYGQCNSSTSTNNYVNIFIENLSAYAIKEAKNRKENGEKWILPSVCIAQSALETGWGKSDLMIKANAYFGIKANSEWKGKVFSSSTKECYDGVNMTTITDLFRAYDSPEGSVKDYYDLLTKSSRYSKACNVTDAETCINEIKNGGYATDPEYVSKVLSIINKYNLTQYDKDIIKDIISESDNNLPNNIGNSDPEITNTTSKTTPTTAVEEPTQKVDGAIHSQSFSIFVIYLGLFIYSCFIIF